ncbi:MAG: alpha-amylase family glycosyl hydrolase [Pacificimonas sp.]
MMKLSILAACLLAASPLAAQTASLEPVRARAPAEEIVYFVLPDRFENGDTANDRGGIDGDALTHGFDPAHKGFYHGGDLAGLTARLDYLEQLGVTAIWFAPIFQNKPVQGGPGQESAGYHGYWVTDFTRVDPHFGTNDEFRAFVDAAHARGMKVYMDIITNHTADVIKYREGYDYRSLADYPWSTKGGPDGARINEGFAGNTVRTEQNFANLTSPDFANVPYVEDAEKTVKVPSWLNDPIHYHNRGNTTFSGENSRYGDFVGLDDLFTEHPRVLQGMIDIYGDWIDRFGIDGFRIDTARHVNPEFWQTFVPAMQKRAAAKGIPNFHIFGEVYRDTADNGYIAQYTRRDGFPAVLDFAFQAAIRDVIARGRGTDTIRAMFDGDVLYEGGEAAALAMPTFLGNHDMGRLSTMIREDMPEISQDELLARVRLAHVMLLTLRGSPVIYSGDEQGFVGDGNDQAAREDMFASLTESYNDNDLIGTDATTADANFDTEHVLFQTIRDFARLRRAHPALSQGRQIVRDYGETPGLLGVARVDPETGREYLLFFNTSAEAIDVNAIAGPGVDTLETLAGQCSPAVTAPGSVRVTLPAFGFAVCAAR